MAEHGPISREEASDREGVKLPPAAHFSVPSGTPSVWDLDEFGAPCWIIDQPGAWLGAWSWIIPSHDLDYGPLAGRWATPPLPRVRLAGPGAMPTLRAFPLEETKHGRPTRESDRPEEVRAAAWLKDIRGVTSRGIADALGFSIRDGRVERTERIRTPDYVVKRAAEFVKSGRRLLHREGVIPWACWDDGRLVGAWWTSVPFWASLTRWYINTITVRAPLEANAELLRMGARYAHLRTVWDPMADIGRPASDVGVMGEVPGEDRRVRAAFMGATSHRLFDVEETERSHRRSRK